jgi:NodT family efflux transporter outer membrane factor (OMF) lipoprotein
MKLRDSKDQQILRTAVCVTVLAFVLCSCNPAPKYARPPVNAPQAFKESAPDQFKEGAGWKVARPEDDKIRGKWWEMYNDPVLNSLEEQVQISNQSVIEAEANFRAARALVVSARSSLFPTVGASPSYTNARFSSTGRTAAVVPGGTGGTGTGGSSTGLAGGSGGGSSLINTFSLPFEVTYTVDFWHRIRNQVAANVFSAEASAADVATALLSTQAALAEDYFEVRALDAQEGILQDTLKNFRDTLNLTLTLFNAGIDSDEDVALARTQLDTATAQATDIGAARAQFEHAIATLLGRPASEFSLPFGTFVPNPPQVPVAVPSALLERRPDIAAAERRVAAANAEVGIARAAYYPNLNLTATGGFQTAHFAEWFNWPSRFWSLGPTLSETLLDFGARRGLNEQAQANYDAAVANYRQIVLNNFQTVEDQLSSLRIFAQEVSQYSTAIQSASHFLDLSLTRFRAGVDSYLNVITAQNAVLSNRETQVQTQLRQMTASVALIMALGGGWDTSQLPQIKNLLAKPGEWNPAGTAIPAGQIAPANPPTVPAIPLPPTQSTPGTTGRPPGDKQ